MQKPGALALARSAWTGFSTDKGFTLAAALSYYAIFAIAPLLLIIISIMGFIFGSEEARAGLVEKVGGVVGQSGREVVETLIKNAAKPGAGAVATMVGAVTAIVGATGLFVQVKDSLNQVWDVRPCKGKAVMRLIKTRVLGFLLVIAITLGLIALLAASAAISGFDKWIKQYVPIPTFVLGLMDLVVTFGVLLALMAVVYKYLPDAVIGWWEAWTGAVITSILFAVGKVELGFYLGHAAPGSVYGAAGSLVVGVLWIYYSAAIFLFGAELTRFYAGAEGRAITPAKGAEWAHTPPVEPAMPWRKKAA